MENYQQELIQKLINKVRTTIQKRGCNTIRGLARCFRNLDSYDGNKKVDKEEFYIGLKENGINLNKQESNVLLSYFDTNGDGFVDFEEFLVAMRGQLNEVRKEVVDLAFKKFDADNSNFISTRDLLGIYDASLHPKVQSGAMTETQVFEEFLQNFGDSNRDGRIEYDEWINYYSAVSASVDNDDHFVELVRISWKL